MLKSRMAHFLEVFYGKSLIIYDFKKITLYSIILSLILKIKSFEIKVKNKSDNCIALIFLIILKRSQTVGES